MANADTELAKSVLSFGVILVEMRLQRVGRRDDLAEGKGSRKNLDEKRVH